MSIQERAWMGQVGQEYTDRNIMTAAELDAVYLRCFGTTRTELNRRFLEDVPLDANILEVGCNIGMQLRHLQQMGFTNLHGIELQQYAIDRLCVEGVEVRQGTAIRLPYPDSAFDLVFTSGVLIHIPGDQVCLATLEITRVARQWIWGFEYYGRPRRSISGRWEDMLWEDDYPTLFSVGTTRLVRRWTEAYRERVVGTVGDMYLLERRPG